MNPEGRQAALDLSFPNDLPEGLRTGELGQKQPGSAQLKGGVGVGPGSAGKIVLAGKFGGVVIGIGGHATGVEDLDRIHQRG